MLRIRKPFGELRVIGEDQQAAGIQIQPAFQRPFYARFMVRFEF